MPFTSLLLPGLVLLLAATQTSAMAATPAVLSQAACCTAFAAAACAEEGGETIERAKLENTRWHLAEVAGLPVANGEGRRETYMQLSPEDSSVGGSGGCNGFGGKYVLDGVSLSFSEIVSTMMYCNEAMETEQAFFTALDKSAGWSIEGLRLELYDSNEALLAVFETR